MDTEIQMTKYCRNFVKLLVELLVVVDDNVHLFGLELCACVQLTKIRNSEPKSSTRYFLFVFFLSLSFSFT
jgi:hypothetical protein